MKRLLHPIVLLLVCLTLAAPSQAADSLFEQGAGTPQFQCDVNTNVCTCEGSKHGSDCLAMRENCWDSDKAARVVCKNPTTQDGGCACCLRGASCTLPHSGSSLAGPSVRSPITHYGAGESLLENPAGRAADDSRDGILERRPSGARPMAGMQTGGGSTTQFQCDVNTMICTCKGSWFGADCRAMQEHCRDAEGTAAGNCGKYTDGTSGCSCCIDGVPCDMPWKPKIGSNVRTPSDTGDLHDRMIEQPLGGVVGRPDGKTVDGPRSRIVEDPGDGILERRPTGGRPMAGIPIGDGGTPQFSCDVDTRLCVCKGDNPLGADCQEVRSSCEDPNGNSKMYCPGKGSCYCCLGGAGLCKIPDAGKIANPSIRTLGGPDDPRDRILEGPSRLGRPESPARTTPAPTPRATVDPTPSRSPAGATPPASCMGDCMAACTRSSPTAACQARCSGMCGGSSSGR